MTEPKVDTLTAKAEEHPDKPGLIWETADGATSQWTYAELNARANRLANALRRTGLEAQQRVIWCGKNAPNPVLMGHAARKTGLTSVPLNYRLTHDEAAYVVDNSDALLVWTDAEFVPLFEGIRDRIPNVREIVVYDGEPGEGMIRAEEFLAGVGEVEPPPATTDPRTMIYTSGTTGAPKGAVRTGQGDPDQLAAMVELIGYRAEDIYLTTGPLYHSGPGGFMGIAFLLGHTVVLQRKFDPEDWLRLVAEHRVTSTFSAPTPIRMICNLPPAVKERYDTSCLRVMIANAAPWSQALKQAYVADFPGESLWEVYGSTELGVNLVLQPPDQLRKPGSCGKPTPGVEVRLLDEDGNQVTEANQPGEVYVRSKSMFDTYHKAPDKYEEDTRGDFHTVGDVAYFDDEGYYYICDRKKDMIISGGMNIYPAEIEAALELHPKIYEAAVFGIPDEQWGERVHATIVAQTGTEIGEEEVVEFARAHLAGYKIPRSLAFTDELPKTGSGKILKRALREPYWSDNARRV